MHTRFVARERRPVPRVNDLFRLDWRAFWLLSCTLGGIVALLAIVLLMHAAGA